MNQVLYLNGLERSTAVNAGVVMCLIPVAALGFGRPWILVLVLALAITACGGDPTEVPSAPTRGAAEAAGFQVFNSA